LADNPIVADHRRASDSPSDVFAAVASVMAAAVDDDGVAGDEIRRTLRPVVTRQLDDELTETSAMIPFFRGQIDD
jgi:DNA-directed RNA polymerase